MKTIALLLALLINVSVIAQSSPSYSRINSNTVKVTWYHDNGQIKEIGYFNNGEKDGNWIMYSETGTKVSEASYTSGIKNGNWMVWNEEGVLTYHMVYENGKRILTTQWDASGNLIAGVQAK